MDVRRSFRGILFNLPIALAQNTLHVKSLPDVRIRTFFTSWPQNRGRITAVGGVNSGTEYLLTAE
ncbi:hypothetical protein T296_11425 [Pantoea agglomerans Eh318]|nr:hypothetical protein T296_11425 [Pantoea agglomerans Eh318]